MNTKRGLLEKWYLFGEQTTSSWKICICSANRQTFLENWHLFGEHIKPPGKNPEKDAPGRKEQIFSKIVSVAASAHTLYEPIIFNTIHYQYKHRLKIPKLLKQNFIFSNTQKMENTLNTAFADINDTQLSPAVVTDEIELLMAQERSHTKKKDDDNKFCTSRHKSIPSP